MGKIEIGRHDADDRRGMTVEIDRLPDDIRIAAEASLPQRVTENRDVVVAGSVFLRGEGAAVQWFTTEHAEVVVSYRGCRHDFRIAIACQRDITAFVGSNTFKRVRPFAVVSEQR